MDQSIFDAAISQWRSCLSACVYVRGEHRTLNINSDNFVIQTYNTAE